jgi:hypothetical protein
MRVPLLPKLRGHFAEFLNHSSPVRLGMLYLTTCVGLGYGPRYHSLEAFLDSIGSPTSPLRARHQTSDIWRADLPTHRPTSLPRDNHRPGWATFLRHPITHPTTPQATGQPPRSVRRPHMSSTGLVSEWRMLGAVPRVREYQPVIHRLRLSASP